VHPEAFVRINYLDSCSLRHLTAFRFHLRASNATSLKMGELSEGCACNPRFATFPVKPGLNREGNRV
jgi:hypothetical protein